MADREKVIRECEWAIDQITVNGFTTLMTKGFFKDVISLLKGNKPVEAELEGGSYTWWYVCGECHTAIDTKDKYCRECGTRIRWGR